VQFDLEATRDRTRAAHALPVSHGVPLTWHNPDNARSCKVYVRKSADLHDQAKWSEQHQWLLERLEEMHRIFAARSDTRHYGR
jgi:hypothetical protein